jgi:hypothetical protein
MSADLPFWKEKTLAEMSREEWESLCDGCGKCCLHKLEDAGNGEVHYTRVACRLLDTKQIRCTRYAERARWVASCAILTPERVVTFGWLPATCAYRLLQEGKDLPGWHPLVTDDRNSVHAAGMSVRGQTVPEREAGDLEDYIIDVETMAAADGK